MLFVIKFPDPSEIFWENTEYFVETEDHLVTDLKTDFPQEIASLYAKNVTRKCQPYTFLEEHGATLEIFVGFIEFKMVFMERTGGFSVWY